VGRGGVVARHLLGGQRILWPAAREIDPSSIPTHPRRPAYPAGAPVGVLRDAPAVRATRPGGPLSSRLFRRCRGGYPPCRPARSARAPDRSIDPVTPGHFIRPVARVPNAAGPLQYCTDLTSSSCHPAVIRRVRRRRRWALPTVVISSVCVPPGHVLLLLPQITNERHGFLVAPSRQVMTMDMGRCI
jgi:hypothetical protein